MAYKNQDPEIWNKKDRAEDWRSIWHSLTSQKEVKDIDEKIKQTDKVYAHLQMVRKNDLTKLISKEEEKYQPF